MKSRIRILVYLAVIAVVAMLCFYPLPYYITKPGMAEELARHGYRISPGTLYPILHGLEKKGYLRSTEHREGKSRRLVYRATPLGRKALDAAKSKVRELFGELIEER